MLKCCNYHPGGKKEVTLGVLEFWALFVVNKTMFSNATTGAISDVLITISPYNTTLNLGKMTISSEVLDLHTSDELSSERSNLSSKTTQQALESKSTELNGVPTRITYPHSSIITVEYAIIDSGRFCDPLAYVHTLPATSLWLDWTDLAAQRHSWENRECEFRISLQTLEYLFLHFRLKSRIIFFKVPYSHWMLFH